MTVNTYSDGLKPSTVNIIISDLAAIKLLSFKPQLSLKSSVLMIIRIPFDIYEQDKCYAQLRLVGQFL